MLTTLKRKISVPMYLVACGIPSCLPQIASAQSTAATDFSSAQTSVTSYISSASPLLVSFYGALMALGVVLLIGGILLAVSSGRK